MHVKVRKTLDGRWSMFFKVQNAVVRTSTFIKVPNHVRKLGPLTPSKEVRDAMVNATMQRKMAKLSLLDLMHYGRENGSFGFAISNLIKISHPELDIGCYERGKLWEEKLGIVLKKVASSMKNYDGCSEMKLVSVIKASFQPDLAENVVKETKKVLGNYRRGKAAGTIQHGFYRSKESDWAGLTFDTHAVGNEVDEIYGHPFSEEDIVGLTSIIEYVTCEVLELAGLVTMDRSGTRMNSEDIQEAIEKDDALKALFEASK